MQRESTQRPSGWDGKNEGREMDPSGIKEVGRKLAGREEPDLAWLTGPDIVSLSLLARSSVIMTVCWHGDSE